MQWVFMHQACQTRTVYATRWEHAGCSEWGVDRGSRSGPEMSLWCAYLARRCGTLQKTPRFYTKETKGTKGKAYVMREM